jgi:hypothetical protein
MSEKLTYEEACRMSLDDLMECNAALDIAIKQMKDANKN